MPQESSKEKVASSKHKNSLLATVYYLLRRSWQAVLPKNKWLRRILIAFILCILAALGGVYGIARWYMWTVRDQPYTMGVTFIPDYASYLGVDPQQTMDALINDLHVRDFRLVSYWSDIEPQQGKYDFSTLDWEFQKADAAHAKVDLTLGLRQPRWPECHPPSWVDTSEPESMWQNQLEQFMTAVVNRYKNNPALQSYQLENEYFLTAFGECTTQTYGRDRFVDEYNLVKKLDPSHPIVIARNNNAIGTPIGKPTPDEFGISIYRRVWDEGGHTHRYLEYPFPSWWYATLAGVQKIMTGKDMIIDEMQAEAWPPHGQPIPQTSLAEQSKSLNAKSLQANMTYAKATGLKTIYYWGAEYWYYRKVVLHDPSVWNVAKNNFAQQTK